MEIPYWYKVLEHFDNKRYFSNGLTIPFLVGSSTIVDPSQSPIDVSTFVEHLVSKNLPKYISVIKCGNIGEYVFGILDSETKTYLLNSPSLYKTIGGLIFADKSLEQISSIEDLKVLFKSHYDGRIASKTFSKNDGIWGSYSLKEETRLKEVII